ncbi:putative reverse transcriptase domain-containing protein [Tanacetum coccineum]
MDPFVNTLSNGRFVWRRVVSPIVNSTVLPKNRGVTDWYQEPKIIMVNVFPHDHADDLPEVEPNQPDLAPAIPEPALVNENEELEEEEEFKEEEEFEEEEPQEEEEDIEVDIGEEENEPELTFPYKEADPLNPLLPASDSEVKVEDMIEPEDETVPNSVHVVGESSTATFLCEDGDSLLPSFMRRDINSLFGQIASLSRRVCVCEMAHALVKKKGKAKDNYYRKLISELGNEVRSSVEERVTALENLVRKFGNAEERVECKKLKRELEEAGLSNTLLQRSCKAIDVPVKDEESPSSELQRSPLSRLDAIGCKDLTMPPKARPLTQAVIERMITSRINEALTADRARRVNVSGAGESRQEFCPAEEVQRMEHELWNLRVKEFNIVAYIQRFNELALMCPRIIEPENVKVDAYIRGLSDNIKGEATSSKPTNLSEVCHKCGKVRQKARYYKEKIIATGANSQPIWTCYDDGEQGHTRNHYPKKNKPQGGDARGRAYVIKDAEQQGPKVVTGTFLLNNRYASVLFDSGSDKSFVNTRFSHLVDINPDKLDVSYEVELADGKVVSTNTVLRGCTLNLVNHLFKINLMPIELGMFDVIIGMDWLAERDAVIVCGKKYIERGCQMFVAYVTEMKSKEKRLKDVPVIRDFPKVFPDDLSGLPPPRQVEF